MPNLDAPARLVFWPECHGEQGGDYDTLRRPWPKLPSVRPRRPGLSP
jgi:hypothetical protein